MNAIKYQIIKLSIGSAGQEVAFNDVTTNKLYRKVTGIKISAPSANLSELVFSSPLTINNEEIFPEDFELKNLTTGQEVAPDNTFYLLNEEANNSTVTGKVKDNSAAQGFVPYSIRIYLRLENPRS